MLAKPPSDILPLLFMMPHPASYWVNTPRLSALCVLISSRSDFASIFNHSFSCQLPFAAGLKSFALFLDISLVSCSVLCVVTVILPLALNPFDIILSPTSLRSCVRFHFLFTFFASSSFINSPLVLHPNYLSAKYQTGKQQERKTTLFLLEPNFKCKINTCVCSDALTVLPCSETFYLGLDGDGEIPCYTKVLLTNNRGENLIKFSLDLAFPLPLNH